MAKLSKAEAARRIGVTRATLYRHIKEGRIPVEADGSIETTELLKRGYTLDASDDTPTGSDRHFDTLSAERVIEILERERERLIQELDAAKAREATAVQEKAALLDLLHTLSLPPARVEAGALTRLKLWFWGHPAR
jgi:excisionase family DNA binding protein